MARRCVLAANAIQKLEDCRDRRQAAEQAENKIANRLQTGGWLQTNPRQPPLKVLVKMVGARGFEPPTPSLPD